MAAPGRSPTLRTALIAFLVEAPFVLLIPLAVVRLVSPDVREQSAWLLPSIVIAHLVKTALLVPLLIYWLRPVEEWVRQREAADPELLRAAARAVYGTPFRFAFIWAVLWGLYYPGIALLLNALDPAFLITGWLAVGILALTSLTLFCAALPLAGAMLAWLLSDHAGALSIDARDRGVPLNVRTVKLKTRLLIFGLCASLAPTLWMAALALSAGVEVGTVGIFGIVAVAWAPVCAWFIARSVADPAGRIAHLLQEIIRRGPESTTERIPVFYADELGALAGGANDLADRLAASNLRISEHVRDLEREHARTQEAVRVRDEFLSIASHELRTPLTTLRLSLDRLERQVEGAGLPALQRSRRTVGQLSSLVGDLLDVSRIQAGRLQLRPEPLGLEALVREAVESLNAAHPDVDLTFTVSAEPVELHADRLRIEQVVVNLVENAVKYGERRPVTVSVTRAGERARVSVSDEGGGIPPALHEQVFERFFRAEATLTRFRGLGLGLYICRTIIEAHGGRIWVESEPGQGATFHFEVPLGSG